jgi:hypothetical protein
LAGKSTGTGCGCLFLIVIVLVIVGACAPKESPEEKAAKDLWVASQLAKAVPDETSYASRLGAYSDSERQTVAAIPASPSPTPVYVYEDKYSSENHKCAEAEAVLIEIYHFKCAYGPDGVLRWLKDEKATIEANKAETERYWAENGGLPGSLSGDGDPVPAPVPDRYTGPRCYAPGGQTYTPC